MKKIYRSRTNQMISGVCGGIAEYINIDATLIRIIWALVACCAGTGVLLYFICAIIIPEEPETFSGGHDFNDVESN